MSEDTTEPQRRVGSSSTEPLPQGENVLFHGCTVVNSGRRFEHVAGGDGRVLRVATVDPETMTVRLVDDRDSEMVVDWPTEGGQFRPLSGPPGEE